MSQYFVSIEDLLGAKWPEDAVDRPADEVLRSLRIAPADLHLDPVKGMGFETHLIIGHRVELGLPGVDLVTVGLGGTQTPIAFGATIYPAPRFHVGPLPVSLLIRHDLLVPMKRGPEEHGLRPFVRDDSRDHVSVVVDEGTVEYTPERGLALRNALVVSVPPFEIKGTRLIIGLEGASAILRDADWSPAIAALGFDQSFRGVYASEATLYWLPELRLAEYDVPGLRMDFENVAVGNAGASFDLELSWPVAFDASGEIDADQTELLGSLFDDQWQIAIASASGSIRANVPESFAVTAYLRVPFFRAAFRTTFGLAYAYDEASETSSYDTSVRLEKASTDPIVVGHGDVSLSLHTFNAHGRLTDAGFEIGGQIGFDASIFGFDVSAESASVDFSHMSGRDDFAFHMQNVTLGTLGTVTEAAFELAGRETDDGYHFEKLRILTELAWHDLAHLIPPGLPELGLPDEARIRAEIRWEDPGIVGQPMRVVVELHTDVSHLDDLWGFIPPLFQPTVRRMTSFFRLTYASVDAFANGPADSTEVHVELSSSLELELPPALADLDIPGLDLLDIQAGDDEGVIRAEYRIDFTANDEDEIELSTGLLIEDAISIDVSLPGAIAEAPLIETSITKMGMQVGVSTGDDDGDGDSGDATIGGRLLFEGDFAFRPLAPTMFPFAAQLNALLRDVGLDEIRGSSKLELSFTDDAFELVLCGEFEDFGIELDVFDLLSSLATGGGSPGGKEIAVDFDIGFRLVGFEIAMGRDPSADPGDEFSFSFDLTVECTMTGLPPLRARMRLSDEEFSLGIIDLVVPLEIPKYPISTADFDRIEVGGVWSQSELDLYVGEIDDDIADLGADIDGAVDQVHAFEWTKDRAALEVKKLLLQLIMEIHGRVGASGHGVFQSLVYADTLVHETILGVLHFETTLKLHFPDIKISIPFDNPAGISISGTGKFTGFATDDPLAALESYELTLGLSAEYIFAKLSGADAIPLPPFGSPYDDGSIAINSLSVGYGYSKNSFAFDFSGELVIPSKLIDDADTSQMLGIGVRLPRHNKVYFKLDTIVFTVGKVTLVIPLPQFDIDLRTPGAPPLVWDGERRRPYWDGFEFIVPGLIHTDFKRLAFSPFFGFFLIPNIKFDGDLELGDDANGLTLILDDVFVLLGLVLGSSGTVPIPLVAEVQSPYFQNITANLRLLGFEINFTLERPFPSPSPLSIIEAFGLLSNPMMEVDPEGALANIVRFRLDNAYVRVPEFVTQMFPGAAGIVDKRYGFTLNIGTLITLVQSVAGSIGPAIDAVKELGDRTLSDIASTWETLTTPFDPWDAVKALPPELRKFRVGGQVAGFEASACLVIATVEEAKASFRAIADGGPPLRALPAATTPTGDDLGSIIDANPAPYDGVNLDASSLDGRRLVGDESHTLMSGIEFRQFAESDLDAIPRDQLDLRDPDAGAIIIGAYVRVFGSQKIRFLGQLFENGSFAMVSTASKSVRLSVFGIPAPFNFQGSATLTLVGGQKRSGAWGSIRATGHFLWEPIPGVLKLSSTPGASLELHSDGRFTIQTGVVVSLFNNAAQITGSALTTHEKVALEGELVFAPEFSNPSFKDLIKLEVTGAGVISAVDQSRSDNTLPVPSFSFDARGAVTILGERFAGAAVRVADHEASFELSFFKPKNAGTDVESHFKILEECEIDVAGRGRANIRRTHRPDFELVGEGAIKVLDAEISGSGGIRSGTMKGGGFEAWMEGDLIWHNRKWLGGRVSIGSKEGLSIRGSTKLALMITPDQIPGTGVDLAHLFFEISMAGEFGLDPQAGNLSFSFEGDWTLGAGLPDTGGDDHAQMIPLASNTFCFDHGVETQLFDITGFGQLPLKPNVSISKGSGAQTVLRAGKLKDSNNSAAEFWTPFTWIGLQNTLLEPVYLGSRDMKGTIREAYSSYKASVTWETVEVNPLSDLTISLRMEKKNGRYPLELVLRDDPDDSDSGIAIPF